MRRKESQFQTLQFDVLAWVLLLTGGIRSRAPNQHFKWAACCHTRSTRRHLFRWYQHAHTSRLNTVDFHLLSQSFGAGWWKVVMWWISIRDEFSFRWLLSPSLPASKRATFVYLYATQTADQDEWRWWWWCSVGWWRSFYLFLLLRTCDFNSERVSIIL